MKAMILAAGRGERMRPLTDTCPKPLLMAGREPLIGWHLRALAAAGVHDVVINHAWLGDQLETVLGDGSAYGVRILYSDEQGSALETAGGIARALPLLGDQPFLVLNGDVFTDYPVAQLMTRAGELDGEQVAAHLVMVPKAGYKTGRDLALSEEGVARLAEDADAPLTFCGLAAYHPAFFKEVSPDVAQPLLPLFTQGMAAGQVRGEVYNGVWLDVGTPERLAEAGRLAASR
ncbi:N-acetylmuramate alpha-1-phosphate uridylyltransferase MurU [Chitinibacteraceae bacterium HSL-7]